MASRFAYLSSEVDWCEGNFQHSEVIAEYYNTISNVSFFLLSPTLLYLNHQYAQQRPLSAYSLSIMLLLIGIFSTYYHLTLSYVGQLLDELSILWTLDLMYIFWVPKCYFPVFIKDRTQFVRLVGLATVVCTLMSFIKPAFNAYLLIIISLHLLYLMCQELKKCSNPRVHRIAAFMAMWWVLAISCWLSDKWFCGFWQRINFCYLHSFWHVLISITLLYGCPLFIYFDTLHEIPSFEPELEYWPSGSWPIALPYLALRKPYKRC
ncbi:alkaline ceramidase 1 [Emydura macquarii macquarii]|uniref:alkaline ceramidase 1 n=1 Tax=Emydura macquarii macquarii TaxID=1129001 RepID=UPI00352A5BEC